MAHIELAQAYVATQPYSLPLREPVDLLGKARRTLAVAKRSVLAKTRQAKADALPLSESTVETLVCASGLAAGLVISLSILL